MNVLTPALLTNNPNGANPRRLDPANLHWGLPRISGSFDAVSLRLINLFDFGHRRGINSALYVDPTTGQPVGNLHP